MEKKPRKRLKKVMVDVCRQVEFYFSDANLRNDRFLQKEMTKSDQRYVSLDVIASFNKIKNMTTDRKTVVMAVQQSSMLELSKDGNMVRRKLPLGTPKHDPDDCMVYVECLPRKADHDWLKRAFSHCGNVVYISLPRYRSTNDIKGFAFVEFETPQEAGRACELMNNPPQDARSRAGKFPTMRGRKRIIPLDFDSTLSYRENVSSGDQQRQQGKSEQYADKRKNRDPKKARAEEEDNAQSASSSILMAKINDLEKQRQRRKRRLDDESENADCHGNLGDQDRKEKKAKDSVRERTAETKREPVAPGDEVKDLDDAKKTLKRKHDDDDDSSNVKEDASKSAKKKASFAEKEKIESGKEKSKVEEEEEEEDGDDDVGRTEQSHEQTRLALIQMGRRMMKRKRSLSEGDKWEVRFRDEEEEEETDEETGDGETKSKPDKRCEIAKKQRRDSCEATRDGDGDAREESVADLSHASSLDKKKRSRKKKLSRRMQEEEDSLFLRVISKKEWLDLREEYLTLQKECLARMKHSTWNEPPATYAELEVVAKPAQTPSAPIEEKLEPSSKENISGPEFVKGAVLGLRCLNTTVTRKDIKEQLDAVSPVAYIDLPDGETQGHIRFHSAEGLQMVLDKDMTQSHIAMTQISDVEEKAYWDKLWLDRENKLKSKHTKKKKKGANKVLQKAERAQAAKAKTHIHFDE